MFGHDVQHVSSSANEAAAHLQLWRVDVGRGEPDLQSLLRCRIGAVDHMFCRNDMDPGCHDEAGPESGARGHTRAHYTDLDDRWADPIDCIRELHV